MRFLNSGYLFFSSCRCYSFFCINFQNLEKASGMEKVFWSCTDVFASRSVLGEERLENFSILRSSFVYGFGFGSPTNTGEEEKR